MNTYFFLPFFFILLLFLANKISEYFNFYDKKELLNGNKISVLGGFAFYIYIVIISILFNDNKLFFLILGLSSVLLILGIFDDIFNISVSKRLFFQSLVIITNLIYLDFHNYLDSSFLIFFIYIFLFFLFMLSINSFNFIDGLDGLSTSIFIIIFGNFLFAQQYINFEFNNLIFIHLIIISLIFIVFNFGFGNIKMYLGNSGSIFFGFFTISFLISFLNNQIFYYLPLLLFPFLLQYLNFLFVIITRIYRGKNIFYADKLHIHHLLSELKINNKIILMIIISLLFITTFINSVIFFNFNYIFYIIYNCMVILLYFLLHYIILKKTNF